MLSKYVVPGNKLEMRAVERTKHVDEPDRKKFLSSAVYDILSEERLEIYMPMEKTKLVLLPVNIEYDIYFYTSAGVYQCFAKVVDRYKTDHKYIVVLELTSDLKRYQRREYYRLSCAIDMKDRELDREEIMAFQDMTRLLKPELPFNRSIIVDISGGGLRFVGDHIYEPDSFLYCRFQLVQQGKNKEYTFVIRVIASVPVEGKHDRFEHRAQYIQMDAKEREEIIHFIFEEERRKRKREKEGN